MKVIGIIGEYNPFHHGHAYLIEKAMKETGAEVCVSVMSGNFTQRGTPAVYDKWDRAQTAVQKGVNVVCELPTVFACNSAEYFARGAVQVLEGFGCIDYLVFGSESGDLEELTKASRFVIENDDYIEKLSKELLKNGNSYPKARSLAAKQLAPDLDEELLKEPNNILAVEYLKHVKNMEPLTVKRRGSSYYESGTKQRELLWEKDAARFEHMEYAYFALVTARILQSQNSTLEQVFSANAGLGNRLKNEIRYVSSTEQLIERIKSKAYTRTRISRLLTQVLLGITDETVENARPYIRLLALDDVGAKFIKEMKKKDCCTLPVITNINREKDLFPEIASTLETDILASDMYNIITKNDLYDYSDYIKAPFIGI